MALVQAANNQWLSTNWSDRVVASRTLVVLLVAGLAVFMAVSVIVALWQEELRWGWWWAVPLGGVFLLAVIGFRVAVQASQEAAQRADQSDDPEPSAAEAKRQPGSGQGPLG